MVMAIKLRRNAMAQLVMVIMAVIFIVLLTQSPTFPTQSSDQLPQSVNSQVKPKEQVDVATANVKRIAVMITVTKDMDILDGCAVLAESARLMHSKYPLDLVAIVHPGVKTSRAPLAKIGFKIIERAVPVNLDNTPEVYQQEVKRAGCCGIYEMLKLEALTLLDYWKVLAVDVDSIFLQNMDELFESEKILQYTQDTPMDIHHFNTVPPAQGGFLLFTPSQKAYDELVAIGQKADWRPGTGWEGFKIGYHWGGTTIQGILPYYFGMKAPHGWSKILDRCKYNNMADLNCTQVPYTDVKSVHFTNCQKPWLCIVVGSANKDMCAYFHKQWWDIRDSYQKRVGLFEPPAPNHASRCPRSGYPALKEIL